jgi:outer membrane protein assembly factor BamB
MKGMALCGSLSLVAVGAFAGAAWVPATPGSGGAARPAPNTSIDRNPVNLTGANPPTDWDVEDGKLRNVKWVQEHGFRGHCSPVVAGGRIFLGTNYRQKDGEKRKYRAVLMCFDERTGKPLWKVEHPMAPPEVDQQALEEGLVSVPAVENDRLYYVTPGCVVVCADVKDGQPVWTYDLMKEQQVYPCLINNCSPLVAGELVYVVTGNGIDQNDKVVAPGAPSFIALEKRTGKPRWKSALPGDKIIHGQWSSPVYAEVGGKGQVIFPGGDGVLYSFEPVTGELIWKFRCTPLKGATKQEQKRPNYIVATPVVHGTRVYVGLGNAPEMGYGNGVGHLFCIDITRQGDVSPANDNFDPKAPENRHSALVWHFGGLAEVGERKVRFGTTLSRVAVHGGLVYAVEETGYFYCLDAATGKLYWEHDLRTGVWSSPYWVGERVYLMAENGEVFIFAHGREKNLVAVRDMDDVVQSTPVAANGVLFVATKSRLFAIAGQ